MEVERYLLASALEGIISQKLARRLCEKCRRLRPTNQYEKNLFKKVLDIDVNEIYSAEGCDECNNGYKGRIALHEVLLINQEIRDALAEGVSKENLRELVYKSDVTTLLQDGLEKVIAGYTTCEEVLKLIELDDDIEGKTQEYRYSLNKALEESDLSKLASAAHANPNNITLTDNTPLDEAKPNAPLSESVTDTNSDKIK
jgi:Tfp pilus assembly pilus retraction ATPase PilT